MRIIGKVCPSFKSQVVQNKKITTITEEDLRGHYTLLFFYAVDFSIVCPTELHSLQTNIEEFKKRTVDVIAISCDSEYAHLAWLKTPLSKGGIEGVTYKLISDTPQRMTKAFGVFDEEFGVPQRATFLIDPELFVQYGAVNNLAFGRSVWEILHVIDAIQFSSVNGVSCPANWEVGQEGLKGIL